MGVRTDGRPCSARQDQIMTRLIVLWEHPTHAAADEVEAMAHWQVEKIATEHAVRGVNITRLEPVRDRSAGYGWLLEVDLEAPRGMRREPVVDSPLVSALLADLRQLGLNPVAMAANRPPDLTAAA
jgi:hypothetical protein